MNISNFDFNLPPELIAHHPVKPRDSSRLLVIGKTLSEKTFHDLPSLLQPGDLLVFNNSKVIPARLFGKKGEAKIEFLLHRKTGKRQLEKFRQARQETKTRRYNNV